MPPNVLAPIRNFQSIGFNGYNVKFSHFPNDLIAVSSGENFGIKGNGSLQIFDCCLPGNPVVRSFDWKDALFDLTWTPGDDNVLLSCSGDGSIQIWNLQHPQGLIEVRQAHSQEVSSIAWTCDKEIPHFVSSSWDGSIKIWDINHSEPLFTSLATLPSIVYEAVWSPIMTDTIATSSGDGTASIWNPMKSNFPFISLPSHNAEILSCDWSHFDQNLLVTAATDSVLRGWDLRSPKTPVFLFAVHQNPIRKVRFSPFHAEEMTSVSYDFSTRLWDITSPAGCVASCTLHSEFVYGLDYSTLQEGLLADCSWDQYITLYRAIERPNSEIL